MTSVKQTEFGGAYDGSTEHSRVHGHLEVSLLPTGAVRVNAGAEIVHMTHGEWTFLVDAVDRIHQERSR